MGRQTNRSLPKVKVIFSCAFGDFQPRVRPIRRFDASLFSALLFLHVVVFLPQVSPPKKRKGWIWNMHFVGNCWFSLLFDVFWKGLGHAARSTDCLHGAIGNLSEDSAPVGVLQSQWSRGTSEISAEKHYIGWFKSEKGLPPFWKIRKLKKKTPRRWLEGAKMCQVRFFFPGFPGKVPGFSTQQDTCWKG